MYSFNRELRTRKSGTGTTVVNVVVAQRPIDLRTTLTKDDERLFFVIASPWGPYVNYFTTWAGPLIPGPKTQIYEQLSRIF